LFEDFDLIEDQEKDLDNLIVIQGDDILEEDFDLDEDLQEDKTMRLNWTSQMMQRIPNNSK